MIYKKIREIIRKKIQKNKLKKRVEVFKKKINKKSDERKMLI